MDIQLFKKFVEYMPQITKRSCVRFGPTYYASAYRVYNQYRTSFDILMSNRGFILVEDDDLVKLELITIVVRQDLRHGNFLSCHTTEELEKQFGLPFFNPKHYPHICPRCKSPAYIGFNVRVDCINKNCK